LTVTRRELLPVALVLLVTICDAAHVPTLSFYFLLAAVPAIVVAGLRAVEEVLQEGGHPHSRAIAILHAVALALVLAAAALRAPLRAEGTVPQAAVSAVIACLAVFAVQGILTVLPTLRRGIRLRPPAVPEPTELPLP
jgi:riboflavin transporter FmnP